MSVIKKGNWFVFICFLFFVLSCGSKLSPSDSCNNYVQCIKARDNLLNTSTNLKRFENDGACWDGQAGSDLCDRACKGGLEYLRTLSDLPKECK